MQNEAAAAGAMIGMFIFLIIYLAIIAIAIAGLWKTFSKAGKPGVAAIVPFFNLYILMKVAGRPGWWLFLYFLPIVGLIFHVIVSLDVAKSFGKDTGFALGLIFLAPIFYCILGFGSAKYLGPAAAQPPAAA